MQMALQAAAGMSPTPNVPRKMNGLAGWQERRAKEILEAHLTAPVRIGTVAQACRLSCSHFSRAFRLSTGRSPYRWLTSRRIARAEILLRDTQLPLAEIAIGCGFADQSHFSRVFHRAIGMSPGAWRRWQGAQAGHGDAAIAA